MNETRCMKLHVHPSGIGLGCCVRGCSIVSGGILMRMRCGMFDWVGVAGGGGDIVYVTVLG